MQKYLDLQSLGTKLNVISAFVVERVRGFIYIEAEGQFDIVEVIFFFYFLRSCYHTSKMFLLFTNIITSTGNG